MTYTHTVVKRSRGSDGKWLRYPGAGYADVEAAIAGARQFAEEQSQAGVTGTEIDVMSRKGRKCVMTIRWGQAAQARGEVSETRWQS